MEKKTNRTAWLFLLIVLLLFSVVFILNASKGIKILTFYGHLLMQVLPILALVYFIMLLTNYFINNKIIKKHMLEGNGLKVWLISIVAGILSVGPIYVWFPLLKDLKDKGVKDRYLATFLYNRGIKIQWLPILVLYFGLKYVIVLAIVMTVFSIPQGLVTEYFSDKDND